MAVSNKSSGSRTKSKVLYLVDGTFFAYRYFYSIRMLTAPDGTPVNALFGFCRMLHNLLLEPKDENCIRSFIVAFDKSRGGFRRELLSSYKENRAATPDALSVQMDAIREAVQVFNLPIVEDPQFEADDLIASYAHQAVNDGYEVRILSSDKDIMQLVSSHIRVRDPVKQTTYDATEVFRKFGVFPEQMIEFQMLVGDAADNIPGVRGFGPKRAAELLKKYHNLDGILAHAGELSKGLRNSLLAAQERFPLTRRLVTLRTDLHLSTPLDEVAEAPIQLDQVIKFCQRYKFDSIIQQLQKIVSPDQPPESTPPSTIGDTAGVSELQKHALDSGWLAIYHALIEEDQGQQLLLGFATASDQRWQLRLTTPLDPQLQKSLQTLLTSSQVQRITYDVKALMHALSPYAVQLGKTEDVMLMDNILHAGKGYRNDLVTLLRRSLDSESFNEQNLTAADFSSLLLKAGFILTNQLKQSRNYFVYSQIDQPMLEILYGVERAGVRVDAQVLRQVAAQLAEQIAPLEKEIYRLVGREFNLASPQQVSTVLFDEMKLTSFKSSRSTSSVVLQQLAREGYQIAALILRWRGLEKLRSTYTTVIPKKINVETGRVHTTYHLTGTTTGRISSSNPSLQNIPLRSEEGKAIRNAFIADRGSCLLCADYSQIELRVLAHIAQVQALKQSFIQKQDIHTAVASQVFAVPQSEVTSSQRRLAKAVTFGIVYGISPYGLSKQLAITFEEADQYIKSYLNRYPEIKEYVRCTRNFCRQHGYVETLSGRRCYVPGILDAQKFRRQYAERLAINAPIQGTAADIIKIASIKLHDTLREQQLHSRIILHVHDEIVLEVPQQEVTRVRQLVSKIMQHAYPLEVPLEVSIGTGPAWGLAKS